MNSDQAFLINCQVDIMGIGFVPHCRSHLAFACLVAATAACKFPESDSTHRCRLSPVMLEEFDSLSVAPMYLGDKRWIAHTPWNGDFGEAVFIDPQEGLPFRIDRGYLQIIATKNDSTDGNWISGLLAAADETGTGTGTQYGYFEARMKLPPGKGVWPAFWLQPIKPAEGSDGSVEIDILEYYGHAPSAYEAYVHVWFQDETRERDFGTNIDVAPGSLVTGFHTYGVDISSEWIVFFLDREEVWRTPTPPELQTPMYPIVNLALGAGWPIDETPDPSVLLVDYIHVFSRGNHGSSECLPGPTPDVLSLDSSLD